MKTFSMLALSLFMPMAVSAQAADHMRDRIHMTEPSQMQDRERIYGSEMMTPQERLEYQNRMRVLKTEQEREAFRLEHHKLMQERAKAQGKTLPDMPPAGMGPGMMGPGVGPGMMGPGSGMGSGQRR